MLEKILLSPYSAVLKLRHKMYDRGIIYKEHECEVPTICVGNITAGGTGKTPHTEMILRMLMDSEEWAYRNVAVLSRGHLRKSRGFQQVMAGGDVNVYGDEPLQIKNKFQQITVAVDRDRVEGCGFLCNPTLLETTKRGRKCRDRDIQPADLIVLDDAFQHRALKAWYNIILVDYNRPVHKDNLLPFGRLRDLPERLGKADIIIVTKCPSYLEDWEKVQWAKSMDISDFDPATCRGVNPEGAEKTVLFTTISYCPLEPVFPEADHRYTYAKSAILFTGIAKDTPLRRYLSDTFKIVKHFRYADHHRYSRSDFSTINSSAKNYPTAVVATTEKDSQRIVGFPKVPEDLKKKLFMVPIEVHFLTEAEQNVFRTSVLDALGRFNQRA